MHIAEGVADPFQPAMPRLDYVLKGIKRSQAEQGRGSRVRLPMTPELLRKLKGILGGRLDQWDTAMIWAACCLCYFGFLRIGEITAPSDSSFDPTQHLGVTDLAVDNRKNPTLLRVNIKRSKTDPFRKGISLFLGRTSSDLCPLSAVIGYLGRRGLKAGPLFMFEDGRLLTRARFVQAISTGLKEAGIEDLKYSSHSFRIGAPTTAAAAGIEGSVIKTLGCWESLAYLQYIKIPRDQLAGYTKKLVQQSN